MIPGIDAHHLFVSGALHEGEKTIVLLSPAEPGFWAHVHGQPEFADGAPDPLDRWSLRVIGGLAAAAGGGAAFPFGGPPHAPFYAWALRSGQFFAAPMRLLVHPVMGLWASLRGAILLPGRLDLPAQAKPPCTACAAPCLRACPAGAMSDQGYNVAACHEVLDQEAGEDCLSQGCAARRACPISRGYGRLPQQSAWHMRHFHK